ncbi:MAG: hypothetical protein WC679_09010 [Bacteroidales bacterium]|jgi:hypothetical protein
MTQEEPFIPIDDQLNKFNTLLKNNNRLFFSAKFGDGKTTFLNEFKKEKQDEYQIITLFPINYQIVDNKDIFELIKRDILLQLLMFKDIELKDEDIKLFKQLSGYFKENSIDIAEDLLVSATNIFSNIPFIPNMEKPLERLFDNINKFNTYKEEANDKSNQRKQINKFLTNKEGCIYEFDAISQLIYMLIKQYKEKKGKDIVLIIEDLDRIDPKHLFRLLNIFSAHFDRVNKGGNEEKSNLTDNKFGFDKIVFVCDYDNIKNIFHHFYGVGTDFKGYITKFSSAPPFRYSLKELYIDYICSILPKEISQYNTLSYLLSEMIVEQLNTEEIKENEKDCLRTIKDNIRNYIPNIIEEKEIINDNNQSLKVKAINNLTILLDILTRFKISFSDFISRLDNEIREYELVCFIGESWQLSELVINNNNNEISFSRSKNNRTFHSISLDKLTEINTPTQEILLIGLGSIIETIYDSKIFVENIIIDK